MTLRINYLFLFFTVFLSCFNAFSSNSKIPKTAVTAISRFGRPAYSGNFKHFNYVNPNAPKGGVLRLSTIGTFDTVNKDIVKGIAAHGILLCYDPLMARSIDEPFTLYALLAEAVEVERDASAITFYLNPCAQFHDGSFVTAEDVSATIKILKDKGLPRYRQYYSRIKNIQVDNAHTIKISFFPLEDGTFDPELPFVIAGLRVLKKDQIETIDFANSGLTKIIGSGPYQISHIDQGRSITLKRNPTYWAKDLPINKGQYNFDVFQVEYFKNAQAQFQAFCAGISNIYFETNPNQWAGYHFAAVTQGHIKKVEITHKRPVPVRTMIFNMRRSVFSDLKVRQALVLAFDFDTINRMLFSGTMKCPHSLFSNTSLAHQGKAEGQEAEILNSYKEQIEPKFLEKILMEPFALAQTKGDGNQRENLAQADYLLKQAGWTLEKGKRVNKEGKLLALEMMIKDPRHEKIALSYKESLKKLGIDLIIRMTDTVQYENRVTESDFDMIIHTWANSLSPGIEQAYYFSAKNADIKGSSNYIGIKDPVAESLAKRVASARDHETMTASVHALDRYIMNQCFQIPLSYDNTLRFAYWVKNLAFPKIDPQVGLDVMSIGWCPTFEKPSP